MAYTVFHIDFNHNMDSMYSSADTESDADYNFEGLKVAIADQLGLESELLHLLVFSRKIYCLKFWY